MNKLIAVFSLLVFTLVITSSIALAYNDHALIAYYALKDELKDKSVKVEPLREFLVKESGVVASALNIAEAWCVDNLKNYSALPEALKFSAKANPENIEERFFKSIRVNLAYFKYNFVQDIGGELGGKFKDRITDWDKLYILNLNWHSDVPFLKIRSADELPAVNVVSTAADIPDYGIDCGLFEDNNTGLGKAYGFGKQLFGDPQKPLQQLAPFHMSYYYDKAVTDEYFNIQSPYALFRVKYYTELAKAAFRTNHDFWGYYFTGLALHYVIDSCQPYHVTVSPGKSDSDILRQVNLSADKQAALMEILYSATDRHLFIEAYWYGKLLAERSGKSRRYFIKALSDKTWDVNLGTGYNDFFIISVLAKRAFGMGKQINPLIEDMTDAQKLKKEIFARNYVGDYRIDDFFLAGKQLDERNLYAISFELMRLSGAACRKVMESVLE